MCSELKQAWSFDTGEKGGLQDNPLVVGRTLYAYTPTQKIVALDAATGKLKWKFDSGVGGIQPARGMTYWTDGKQGRMFAGVMNLSLLPGRGDGASRCAGFGEGGRIDLRKELRGNYEEQSIVLTTPGVIYKDMIIVGGRNPETHPAPPGDIRAFDVRTGKLRWSFHTIPHPGEPGYETWPAEAWKTAGAANNWAGMAVDAERGIVYAPTGSAVFDFYGGDRVGNDLYADTLLALDANTGKRLWHFQGVHHDMWDRDFPSEPALYTVKRDGKTMSRRANDQAGVSLPLRSRERPAAVSDSRSGLSGEHGPGRGDLAHAAKAGCAGAVCAAAADGGDADHADAGGACVGGEGVQRPFSSDGQFVPLSVGKQTVVFPGFDGGAEWGGPAIDPATNVLYVNATEMAWTGGLVPAQPGGQPGAQVYQNQCAMCHGPDRAGAPPAFPSLVGVLGRLSMQQVTDNIKKGNGRMPSFPNIDDAQLTALIEFLRTDAAAGAGKEAGSVPAQAMTAQEPEDKAGASVYADHCAICHGDHREGIAPAFPMLIGVGNRLTRAQIVDMIQNGKNQMPAAPDLQGSDLEALLRYLGVASTEAQKRKSAYAHAYDQEKYIFTGYRKFLDPDGYPAIVPPWGTLNAIDLKTGKYLWKIPLGEYPELAAKGMKNTGTENYGGPVVTAGGVVFIGATVYDRKFRAFDSRDGKLLWETELPFSGVARRRPT